jgi:hypothetical protein
MLPSVDKQQASSGIMAAQNSAPDLSVDGYNNVLLDDKSRRKSMPIFAHDQGAGRGGGMSEGVKLETVLWGGGGAIIGSLAGPVGTIVGGAVGFLIGLSIGIVMPRKQSSPDFRG